MLKKVILVTSGRYDKANDLTDLGIEDARWLGKQIVLHGLKPQIVFYTAEICCVYTAMVLAGAVESVKYHASFPIIGYGANRSMEKDQFWRRFRNMLRTPETAHTYFAEVFRIPDDVEEVAVVSIPGFGGMFPTRTLGRIAYDYTCWTCPTVYALDFSRQELIPSANVVERFGCV